MGDGYVGRSWKSSGNTHSEIPPHTHEDGQRGQSRWAGIWRYWSLCVENSTTGTKEFDVVTV